MSALNFEFVISCILTVPQFKFWILPLHVSTKKTQQIIHIHPSIHQTADLNNETDLPSPKSSSIPSMACACHKCICVISISIFSACLFKTPYFDCYNKFYIIKYSLRNHFIKKKNLYQFFYFTYKRHLNYHTPSRFLSRYIWLKYFWFFITHLFGKYFS